MATSSSKHPKEPLTGPTGLQSYKLGMLVAITPGMDSKGPRAKRTKPKYHTLGRKRKIKKRIAASLQRTHRMGVDRATL